MAQVDLSGTKIFFTKTWSLSKAAIWRQVPKLEAGGPCQGNSKGAPGRVKAEDVKFCYDRLGYVKFD
jgi:hypothetical protein